MTAVNENGHIPTSGWDEKKAGF